MVPLLAFAFHAAADLFLITGTPTPKGDARYEAALWQLRGNGELTKVKTIVPAADGLHRVDLLQQSQKAFLLTKYPNEKLIVFDLKSQTISKACPFPNTFMQWASENPLTYQARRSLSDLMEMSLSPDKDCSTSIRTLTPAEYVFPSDYGSSGIGTHASNEVFLNGVDADGKVRTRIDQQWVYGDLQIPAKFLNGNRFVVPNENTPEVTIFISRDRKTNSGDYLLLDKQRREWKAVSGANLTNGRIFGLHVAFLEYENRPKREPDEFLRPIHLERESDKEWRARQSKYGPDILGEFYWSDWRFPGKLHIYNVRTEAWHVIRTDQADSQILLIDGKTVYYRASDRLYHTELTEARELNGKLIATSEAIRDAHWVFLAN